MATTISLPVFSFRRLPTPFEETNNKLNAIAVVNVLDLPDFSEWRKINPREVNPNNHVAKAVEESLADNPDFFFINRGLVLTVESYDFNQKNGILQLHLDDPNVHGLLDGGHTYHILMRDRDRLVGSDLNQFVKIEILTGFPPSDAVEIVEGRNTSNQVKPKSIANLNRAFDELKSVIQDTHYANQIAYVENAAGVIDIRELISFLYIFANSNSKSQPIAAYQAKSTCLDDFAEDFVNGGSKYKPVYTIARDVFELWDHIHYVLPDLYNNGFKGRRFGRLSGISGSQDGPIQTQLYFTGWESPFKIPAAIKYPILAAFRAFVEIDPETGSYRWGSGVDPFAVLRSELGIQMAERVGASIRDTRNPSKTGKDRSLWENCYQLARITYLEQKQGL